MSLEIKTSNSNLDENVLLQLNEQFSSEFVECREKPKQHVEINEAKENKIIVVDMLLYSWLIL